jgi:hypothetical protein
MKWARVFTSDGDIIVCHESLFSSWASGSDRLWTSWFDLDLPGMISTDRKFREVEVDGLRLGVPSQHFLYFLEKLDSAPCCKRVNDGSMSPVCHVVRSWPFSILLTEDQRDRVVSQLKLQFDDAIAEGAADAADLMAARRELNDTGAVRVVGMSPRQSGSLNSSN